MRIMSFNVLCCTKYGIKWEHRVPKVVEIIHRYAPESFGVQEATPDWMHALEKALPEYAWVGVGRDDGAWKG